MKNYRHATPIKQQDQSKSLLSVASNFPSQMTKKQRRSALILGFIACSSVALALSNNSSNQQSSTIAAKERSSQAVELNFERPPAETSNHQRDINSHNGLPAKPAAAAAPAKTLHSANTGIIKNAESANQTKQLVKQHTLKSGDNLSSIFQNVGLSAKDVYQITQSGDQGRALTRMYPGESLNFVFSGNTLTEIIREKSRLESIHFKPSETGGFTSEVKVRTPEVRQTHKSAVVTQSLALAADRAGLSATTTMNMANIFGGVVDFIYDVRAGDRFTVVYEEKYLDDEKIGEGSIVAAQYVNRGKAYNAYRFEDEHGEIGYYNAEGVSMRKAFLRAPLDFTRVSSGFNLKRLHPITKQVRPHRGTDYAAPTGTPVFSVGEGRVIASGYSNANGKYVFIKHGEAYTTKYLHLSRRNVKNGQRVKQGQIIGKVGCTGMCTGPHLHYEFLVNGVHRNPRTIINKLPKAKKLDDSELPAFTLATSQSREALSQYSSLFEIASNE